MRRHLTVALLLAGLSSVANAQPTASLTFGDGAPVTFVDWLTVNNATVGIGDVDDNVVYYLKEQEIGGLQSWLIFFDPMGNRSVTGTVTFAAPITQLFATAVGVNTTSAAFRLAPTVSYGAVNQTGLESGDEAMFLGNTLTIDWTASDPGDHVRVLTSTVPEPSTYALIASGLALIGAFSPRRRPTSAA